MRATALALLAVACGHAPTSGPGQPSARSSPYVKTYPALRWVPGKATYAFTARTTADLVAIERELALVAGLADDFDLSQAEDELRRDVGFDPLSIDGLREVGVDPDGGVAVFSEGLSPTLAIALSDPQRTAGFIEEHRAGGVAVEVSREAGVDVYTYAAGHDAHLHWAIADGWLFVHVEFTAEREPELAWYRDLRGGGDFDLGAAVGATPAPLVGLANVPELRTRLARIGTPRACLDQLAPVGRALVTAGVTGKDATGTITLEVASAGLASLAIAPPPGWAAAREGAAIQAEWTADLDRAVPVLAACDERDSRDLAELGVRAGGGFVHALDVDDLDGKGAAWYVARDTHLLDDALDRIPGLRFGSHQRTVGGVAVVDVSMPMIPSFSYARTPTTATIAVGGLIDAIVAGKAAPATSLAHVEVHPWGLSDDVWDAILRYAAHMDSDTNRKQAIRRAHRWDLGRVDLEARPGALVLTARGHVHT